MTRHLLAAAALAVVAVATCGGPLVARATQAPFAVGGAGHAVRFAGLLQTQEIRLPLVDATASPTPAPTDALTVCTWYRAMRPVGTTSSGVDGGYSSVLATLVGPYYAPRGGDLFTIADFGELYVSVGDTFYVTGISTLRDDAWHHACVTWDATTGHVFAHQDAGSPDEDAPQLASNSVRDPYDYYDDYYALTYEYYDDPVPLLMEPLPTPSYWVLGRQGGDAFNVPWAGDLDEFCVWNRALSADEVADVYHLGCMAGAPASAAHLVHYLRFDSDKMGGDEEEPSVWDEVGGADGAGAFAGVRKDVIAGFHRDFGVSSVAEELRGVADVAHIGSRLPVSFNGSTLVASFAPGDTVGTLGDGDAATGTRVVLSCVACDSVEITTLPSAGALYQPAASGAGPAALITSAGTALTPTASLHDADGGALQWGVLYVPSSAGVASDTFAYTGVNDLAVDGPQTAPVLLLNNTAPFAADHDYTLTGDSVTTLSLPWMFARDAEGDDVTAYITKLPAPATGLRVFQLDVPFGTGPCLPFAGSGSGSESASASASSSSSGSGSGSGSGDFGCRDAIWEDMSPTEVTGDDLPVRVTGLFGLYNIVHDAAAQAAHAAAASGSGSADGACDDVASASGSSSASASASASASGSGSGVIECNRLDYTLTYRVFDGRLFSDDAVMHFTVHETNTPPTPADLEIANVVEDSTLTDGAPGDATLVQLVATDTNKDVPFVTVATLPRNGVLYQRTSGGGVGPQVTDSNAAGRLDQWASQVEVSTFWEVATGEQLWSGDVVVGPPNTFPAHGEQLYNWQPSEGGAGGVDTDGVPYGDYRRQWMEVTVATPVVVRSIEVYETWHPGAVTRLLVHDDYADAWVTVWQEPSRVEQVNPDPDQTQSAIFAPTLCPSTVPSTRVRIEFDIATLEHWVAVDAVLVSGDQVPAGTVVQDHALGLWYVPLPDFHGVDTFTYVVNDCPYYTRARNLDAAARTAGVTVTVVPVNDAPIVVRAALFDNDSSEFVDMRAAAGAAVYGNAAAAAAAVSTVDDVDVVTMAQGSTAFLVLGAADAEDSAEDLVFTLTQVPNAEVGGSVSTAVSSTAADGGASTVAAGVALAVGDIIPADSTSDDAQSAVSNVTSLIVDAGSTLTSGGVILTRTLRPASRVVAFQAAPATSSACGSGLVGYSVADSAGLLATYEGAIRINVACPLEETPSGISLAVLLFIIVGAAAVVVCLAVSLWHQWRQTREAREHAAGDYLDKLLRRASKAVKRALRQQFVVQIVFFTMEAADITTDWIAFSTIVDNLRDTDTSFLVVYTVLIALATAVGATALWMRIRLAYQLQREITHGIDLRDLGRLGRTSTAQPGELRKAAKIAHGAVAPVNGSIGAVPLVTSRDASSARAGAAGADEPTRGSSDADGRPAASTPGAMLTGASGAVRVGPFASLAEEALSTMRYIHTYQSTRLTDLDAPGSLGSGSHRGSSHHGGGSGGVVGMGLPKEAFGLSAEEEARVATQRVIQRHLQDAGELRRRGSVLVDTADTLGQTNEGGELTSSNPKVRLMQVQRQLRMSVVTLALALFEDVPMASLNVFILMSQNLPAQESSALLVSILLSSMLLGVKIRSVDKYVTLRAKEAELQSELALLAAREAAVEAGEDEGAWIANKEGAASGKDVGVGQDAGAMMLGFLG